MVKKEFFNLPPTPYFPPKKKPLSLISQKKNISVIVHVFKSDKFCFAREENEQKKSRVKKAASVYVSGSLLCLFLPAAVGPQVY